MRLLLALVCDDARADPDGKLDIHGVFHDLYAPGFPARQEHMVLVLVVEWEREDGGRYRFRVDLVGPDERPSFTVEGHTDVEPRPPGAAPARTRLVMPLEGVIFPVEGPYRFRVRIKGQELDGPTLHLVRTEAAGEPFSREELPGEGAAGGPPPDSRPDGGDGPPGSG